MINFSTIIENWQALGLTSLISGAFAWWVGPKLKKSTEKLAEETAEEKGLSNLGKILELNASEIARVKKDFKEQLEPLKKIIEDQGEIIKAKNIQLSEQIGIIETKNKQLEEQKKIVIGYTKHIAKLEEIIERYKVKYGEL